MEDMKPASKWQMMLDQLASQFPAAQSAIDEINDIIGSSSEEEPTPEVTEESDLDEGQLPVPVSAPN